MNLGLDTLRQARSRQNNDIINIGRNLARDYATVRPNLFPTRKRLGNQV